MSQNPYDHFALTVGQDADTEEEILRCDCCEKPFVLSELVAWDGLQCCSPCRDLGVVDAKKEFAEMVEEVIKAYQDKLDAHAMYEFLQARSIQMITGWRLTV